MLFVIKMLLIWVLKKRIKWYNNEKKIEKNKEFDWINLLYLFYVCVKWFIFYKCNIDILNVFIWNIMYYY